MELAVVFECARCRLEVLRPLLDLGPGRVSTCPQCETSLDLTEQSLGRLRQTLCSWSNDGSPQNP